MKEMSLTPEIERKQKISVFSLKFSPVFGFQSIRGSRNSMEDTVSVIPNFMYVPSAMYIGDNRVDGVSESLAAHFFAVYDGHGGPQVAHYCRDRLHLALQEEINTVAHETMTAKLQLQWEQVLKNSFKKVDDEVGNLDIMTVGSTACISVINSSHIIIANCGDSRAVLSRGQETIPLSKDHKPNREDEKARIQGAGGFVGEWDGQRVCGILAMTRSIGDEYLKPYIIPEPEVTVTARAKNDNCLILASDGLWDVMTNEEACIAARKRIKIWHLNNNEKVADTSLVDPAAQAAAEYITTLAIRKGSRDNISVIVIDLRRGLNIKC